MLPSWSFWVGIACRTAHRTGASFFLLLEHKKNHIYIYFLLPSRVIRASRLPRPRLKIFALSTSTKCPMTLMRPSKPLLKINFRLRLQIHRLFTKATFETLLASQPLAPVHLSVCTIHTWLRVSLLACKYSAFFFSKRIWFPLTLKGGRHE